MTTAEQESENNKSAAEILASQKTGDMEDLANPSTESTSTDPPSTSGNTAETPSSAAKTPAEAIKEQVTDSSSPSTGDRHITTTAEEAHSEHPPLVSRDTTSSTIDGADDNASMIPLGKGQQSYSATPAEPAETLTTSATDDTSKSGLKSDIAAAREALISSVAACQEGRAAVAFSDEDKGTDEGKTEVKQVLSGHPGGIDSVLKQLNRGKTFDVIGAHGPSSSDVEPKTLDDVDAFVVGTVDDGKSKGIGTSATGPSDATEAATGLKEVGVPSEETGKDEISPKEALEDGPASESTEATPAEGLTSLQKEELDKVPDTGVESTTAAEPIGAAANSTKEDPTTNGETEAAAAAVPAATTIPTSPSGGGLAAKLRAEVEARAKATREGKYGETAAPAGATTTKEVTPESSTTTPKAAVATSALTASKPEAAATAPAIDTDPSTKPSAFKEEFDNESPKTPSSPKATGVSSPTSPRLSYADKGNRSPQLATSPSKSGNFMSGLFRRRSKKVTPGSASEKAGPASPTGSASEASPVSPSAGVINFTGPVLSKTEFDENGNTISRAPTLKRKTKSGADGAADVSETPAPTVKEDVAEEPATKEVAAAEEPSTAAVATESTTEPETKKASIEPATEGFKKDDVVGVDGDKTDDLVDETPAVAEETPAYADDTEAVLAEDPSTEEAPIAADEALVAEDSASPTAEDAVAGDVPAIESEVAAAEESAHPSAEAAVEGDNLAIESEVRAAGTEPVEDTTAVDESAAVEETADKGVADPKEEEAAVAPVLDLATKTDSVPETPSKANGYPSYTTEKSTTTSPHFATEAPRSPKSPRTSSGGGFFGLFRSRSRKDKSFKEPTSPAAAYASRGAVSSDTPTSPRSPTMVDASTEMDPDESAVGGDLSALGSPVAAGHDRALEEAPEEVVEEAPAEAETEPEPAEEKLVEEEPVEEEIPDDRSITVIAAEIPLPAPTYTAKTLARHERERKKREHEEAVERERIRRENELLAKRERILTAYTGKQDFSKVPKPVRNKPFGNKKELDGIQHVTKVDKKAQKQEDLVRTNSRGSSINDPASPPLSPVLNPQYNTETPGSPTSPSSKKSNRFSQVLYKVQTTLVKE